MSFFNKLADGVAAAADKLDDAQPAAPAAAAPAAAAPAAAAPAAAAPAAAAPAAPAAGAAAAAPPATGEAPVDIKATLMHAADAAKQGNYMGAVQDVMKTGLVQKLAASQGKPHGDQAAAGGGSGDLVGNLVHQAEGLLGGAGKTGGGAGGANPLGSLLGALGGAGDAKPAAPK